MWSSFAAALHGIARAWKTQAHFRFDIVFGCLVLFGGVVFRLSLSEWLALVAAVTAMLVLELLNTVAELLCDLLEPRLHGAVAMVKDVAAAAVLVGAIGVAIVGVLIFLPHIA